MGDGAIKSDLIAPCGMNCGVCGAHLRAKKPCPGCRLVRPDRPEGRATCSLRDCETRSGKYCFACAKYPCLRLRKLDARYRAKYGMSEIENLECVKAHGIRAFVAKERARWIDDAGVFCVHNGKRYTVKAK